MVRHIGIIEPIIPKNNPSITNGIFIAVLDAPTKRIISISVFLEYIVNLMVLAIRNDVTNTNATTAHRHAFSTTLNTTIS